MKGLHEGLIRKAQVSITLADRAPRAIILGEKEEWCTRATSAPQLAKAHVPSLDEDFLVLFIARTGILAKLQSRK